eukprot:XP_001704358.1 Hypothetical protein GL50803_18892 [Giardia lamblia ATCC 50803]
MCTSLYIIPGPVGLDQGGEFRVRRQRRLHGIEAVHCLLRKGSSICGWKGRSLRSPCRRGWSYYRLGTKSFYLELQIIYDNKVSVYALPQHLVFRFQGHYPVLKPLPLPQKAIPLLKKRLS